MMSMTAVDNDNDNNNGNNNDDGMGCMDEEEDDESMRETSYRLLWPTHADVKVPGLPGDQDQG